MNGDNGEGVERTPGFEGLRGHRYMNLTTFRKSGEGVVTPVWFTEETQGSAGGRLYVYTTGDSGKVKRVRNDARVLVGPSDVRGRPLGPDVAGEARLLPPCEAAVAERRLRHKYGLQKRLFELLQRLPGLTHGGRAYLEIAPAPRDGPR